MFGVFHIAADLMDIKHELGYFAHVKELGLNLRLPAKLLEVIERDYRWTSDQLGAVLFHWLTRNYAVEKHGLPTWSALANAVKPIDRALAFEIKKNHQLSSYMYTVCVHYVDSITSSSLHAALNTSSVLCTIYFCCMTSFLC